MNLSAEVEASDEAPLEGKDGLDKTERCSFYPCYCTGTKANAYPLLHDFPNINVLCSILSVSSQVLKHIWHVLTEKINPQSNNSESLVANEEKASIATANKNNSIARLKRAAATAVSAAAVKAKFLAEHEEYEIRKLTALMIEKLADFDLCCDCYNEGKFDAGMAKTDFILMDSAEVSGGASGTSWTDEETLLLLEGSAEQALTEKGTAQTPEKMEVEDKVEGEDNANERSLQRQQRATMHLQTLESQKQSSDARPSANADTSGENLSNVAIDILKSAFEAIGQSPEHEGSFADIGNPVMALAAFLAGLVEDDNATTSCRSSLKAISEVSPSLQLASRHCFILEDPPDDLKDTCDIVRPSIDTEKKTINEKEDSAISVDKQNNSAISPNDHQESENKNSSSDDHPLVDAKTNNVESSDPPLLDKSASNNTEGSNTVASNRKDEPSAEVEASDEAPLKGKDGLDKTEDAASTPATAQEQKQSQTFENGKIEESNNSESLVANEEKASIATANKNNSIARLKRAAATAVSAAAVKAKFLAEHEEYEIRKLTALMIEKLFQKIEVKMSLFAEIEQVVLRTREYTEKTRKKLLMERNAIIAARMGALPSRPNQPGVTGNRLPPGYGNPNVRPPNTMPRPSS
ncbi:hypothetical protein PR202_ga13267 [Eleusine coracana subsp. coracana]|uniref:SMARCC C-terminal domain-containing protein n=1 Tax=Eleusine coracana subsp. coracana TaxID=191504 RepID=A0AAV5CDL4_ELECO|nr:hypothetical protein PR202_ga13267 [Eleusine coracana subsp. coracana]